MTQTTVWLSPSARSYACLCEPCLEAARISGALFADALAGASVRGSVALETDLAVISCAAGHRIELRRIERPATLPRSDHRQLHLA
jgi:hypothetical protein